MDSPTIITVSQLDSTFGCMFLGGIFTSILWGVGCLQLWLYFEKHSRTDQRWLKTYVILIWALDVAHQVIIVQYLYSAFVKSIANPSILGRIPKSLHFTSVTTALVDAMVQSIFLRRVWFVSRKNKIVTGILCTLVLGQFAASMTYFGQVYNVIELAHYATVAHTQLTMSCIAVVADTLLALTLVYLLWRGRTGFRKTDTVVNRLITYAIGTGFITALWAIAALIGVEVAPNSLFDLLVDWVIPKLYFNCMLASLNARSGLRETLADEEAELSIQLEDSAAIADSSTSSDLPRTAQTSLSKRAKTLFLGCLCRASAARPIECSVGAEIEFPGDPQQKGGIRMFNFDATSTSSV